MGKDCAFELIGNKTENAMIVANKTFIKPHSKLITIMVIICLLILCFIKVPSLGISIL
jgi:hypothetical protein